MPGRHAGRSGAAAARRLVYGAHRRGAPRAGAVALAAVLVLMGGCAFRRLREDLERLQTFGVLGGAVSREPEDDGPIVVALCTGTGPDVVDTFILDRPGSYFFTAPAGTYRLAAFVDRNRDLAYEPGEPAAWYGAPTDVAVGGGRTIGHLDIHIGSPGVRLDVPISVGNPGRRRAPEMPPMHVGELVTLDDPRFTDANGKRGLWQPVDFLFDVGAGIYFLEPFDAKKTPVLFVHGAGGHPGNWRYLVEHLDRTKFQPWLAYYPSGLALPLTARGMARWTRAAATHYGVKHVIIVAHSMGGLVSRAAINEITTHGDGTLLSLFVTLSTPWNGHPAAARGVEQAPVVIPTWPDLVPDSPFLVGLYATSLPPGCPYYLLFSYNGRSMFLREPNDGVVPVASELPMRAQAAAVRMYGFDESHVGILGSEEASRTLNALLAAAVR